MDGVGEVFRTNLKVPGTDRPLKFLRTVIFLKINRRKQEVMARPPKPPAYLDEIAGQQWKRKRSNWPNAEI
jgi:hypothetical protein